MLYGYIVASRYLFNYVHMFVFIFLFYINYHLLPTNLRLCHIFAPILTYVSFTRSSVYLLDRLDIFHLPTYLHSHTRSHVNQNSCHVERTYSIIHAAESFLLEKLTGLQLVKKFPAFYGTRKFITAFTSACHLNLS